jgi:hypothetical protein
MKGRAFIRSEPLQVNSSMDNHRLDHTTTVLTVVCILSFHISIWSIHLFHLINPLR